MVSDISRATETVETVRLAATAGLYRLFRKRTHFLLYMT
jgi:hypothetical protein